MLDIKFIREKSELVEENLKKRHNPEKLKQLKELIKYDKEYRETLQKLEELKHKKNLVNREIAKTKDKKKIAEMKKVSEEITTLDKKQEELKQKVDSLLLTIPNLLHESVPYGKDENDNKEIRTWGKPPKFSFKPKNHLELLQDLGLVDADRAAKVAGHGFFYFKNDLVLLDYALMKFTIDFMLKRGYVLINPPYMLHEKPYQGVTDMAFFKDQLYKIQDEDLYLIATSEHAIGAMLMDEVIDKKDLPLRLVGVSPCFRKEVGAHGKYTKGLFRMHQFNKIEQFIFCLPEQSWQLHEELEKNSEDLYKALELPFRVVNVCTGDIGDIAAKKYDIELWMADEKYREAGSNSNCTDYQARRLNVKYREKEGAAPAGFVHTLNNTAIATSRTMLAILEVHQQPDGSVKIPKALQPYMGKTEIRKK
ncbi:MAG: serine--tRNA ligase [Candidatus Aenigmarchaeota archaeon]|nr:serine--tRNA ligase [Candidatus Aenigmarchaeota archaeon]